MNKNASKVVLGPVPTALVMLAATIMLLIGCKKPGVADSQGNRDSLASQAAEGSDAEKVSMLRLSRNLLSLRRDPEAVFDQAASVDAVESLVALSDLCDLGFGAVDFSKLSVVVYQPDMGPLLSVNGTIGELGASVSCLVASKEYIKEMKERALREVEASLYGVILPGAIEARREPCAILRRWNQRKRDEDDCGFAMSYFVENFVLEISNVTPVHSVSRNTLESINRRVLSKFSMHNEDLLSALEEADFLE